MMIDPSVIEAKIVEAEVMKLDGIEAFSLPDGVAEAAVEDGRPYALFLADLLSLGLDQWREHQRPKLFNP